MAIEWAAPRYLSRSKGQSAVAAAAYNLRTRLLDERLGRNTPDWSDLAETRLYHEVLLPPGAVSEFARPQILWNAVEEAERRRNSQVALEIVLALPADGEMSPEQRVQIARDFALQHFVRHGLAVQLNIHRPLKPPEDQPVNYHAHLLVTTRRLEGDRFARRKARDLQPTVRLIGRRPVVTEAPHLWGTTWRTFQDQWFEQHGLSLRVDPQNLIPYIHIGPKRFQHPDDPRIAENTARQQANAGHRQSLWQMALELSPQLAAIDHEANHHLSEIHRAEGAINRFFAPKQAKAAEEIDKRWAQMGTVRRLLHYVGTAVPHISALRDIDIERWQKERDTMKWMQEQRWGIDLKHHLDRVAALRLQARDELNAIRPLALRELARRQAPQQKQELHVAYRRPERRHAQRL